MRPERSNDGAGVILGLQQTGNEDLLIRADRRGLGLQADEVGVLTRQDIAVGMPPAALTSVAGELNECLTLSFVGDTVEIEQVTHIADVEPGPLTGLNARHLGWMPFKPSGHVVAGQARIRRKAAKFSR